MGIEVVGEDEAIVAQTRAYAEYRVFTALATHTERVRRVRVVLRHGSETEAGAAFTCEVSVLLFELGRRVRTRAHGPHPYAAINRAVDRIATAFSRSAPSPLLPRGRIGDAGT